MPFKPAQYGSRNRERKVIWGAIKCAGVQSGFTWKRAEFQRFTIVRALFGIVNTF